MAIQCFRGFPAPKTFLHKRGTSRLFVGNFLSHFGEKSRRGTLLYLGNYLISEKFLDIGGGYHNFPIKNIISEYWKLSEMKTSVFLNFFPYRECLRLRRWYHVFLSELLWSLVTEKFVEVPFSVFKKPNSKNFMHSRGNRLFCQKYSVSQYHRIR